MVIIVMSSTSTLPPSSVTTVACVYLLDESIVEYFFLIGPSCIVPVVATKNFGQINERWPLLRLATKKGTTGFLR